MTYSDRKISFLSAISFVIMVFFMLPVFLIVRANDASSTVSPTEITAQESFDQPSATTAQSIIDGPTTASTEELYDNPSATTTSVPESDQSATMTLEISNNSAEAVALKLLDQPCFREDEQSSILIHPRFRDGRTNIIFYRDYGTSLGYVAETVATGDRPFSEYYDPAPGEGKYIVMEYRNDGGAFSCSGITPSECMNDPHFVSQLGFEILK